MSNILDMNLADFSTTYHSWVDNPEEWDEAIVQWHVEAKGRPPHIHEMRHAYWRVIKEGERWGTLRNALQDTWPKETTSNGPVPVIVPPVSSPGGSVISRTIQVTGPDDGEFVPRMYSYWSNAVILNNAVHVFAGHADGRPRFFQIKASGQVAALGSLAVAYSGTTEGWYWDAQGWLYILDGPRLHRVQPFSGEDHVVFSIEHSHPGCRLWQAHSSDDGQVHSATVQRVVQKGAYPNVGTVVWRQGDMLYEPATGVLDESAVTPDGGWVVIKDSEDNLVINLATGERYWIRDAEGAVGHSDCGPGYVVGEDNQHGACVRWDLRTRQRTELFKTWNMGHVSVRNGVCLLSDQRYIGVVSLVGAGAYPFLEHGMTGHDYDHQVMANLDPTGRVACWIGDRGTGRFDVYVTPVP